MAIISDTTKIDKAFKFVSGKGYTSTQKGVDNEDAPSGFIVGTNSIFAQDAGIPTTAPGASTSILTYYGAGSPVRFKMVYDVSSPLNKAWYASTDGSSLVNMRNTRVPNWIPSTFGNYTIRIFLTLGASTSAAPLAEIFFSDATSPLFDCKTGILTFESDPLAAYASLPGGPPNGIQISGYVYTGPLLSQIFDGNGNFTGGLSDFGTSTSLASFVNPNKSFEVSSPFALPTTWTTETTPYGTSAILAVGQFPNGEGIVAGTGIISYSWGHGVWKKTITIPTLGVTTSVWCGTDDATAYICDTSGRILQTTDNGRNWASLSTQAFVTRAIWGSGLTDIFIVGNGGNIIHSTNGASFSAQTNSDGYDLYAIWGSSSADIFAVGLSGTIRHSVGAGTWTGQTSSTVNDLLSVFGFSSTEIYTGGVLGTLLKSVGGGSWTNFNTGLPGTFAVTGLYGVSFSGTKKLYASGFDTSSNNYKVYISSGTNNWTLEATYTGPESQAFLIAGGISGIFGGLDTGRIAVLHKNPIEIIHGHARIDGYLHVRGSVDAKNADLATLNLTPPTLASPAITVSPLTPVNYTVLSSFTSDSGEGFRFWRESSTVYTLDVGSKVTIGNDGITPFAAGGRIRLGGFTTSPSTTARGEIETVSSTALTVVAYQDSLNLISSTGNIEITPGSGQKVNLNGTSQINGVLNVTSFAQILGGIIVSAGGASVTGNSSVIGNLTVSGYVSPISFSIGSNSLPTPAYTTGRVYRDTVPLAYGSVRNNAGTVSLLNGFNVSAVSRISQGLVTVTLGTAGVTGTSNSYTVFVTIDYTNSASGQIARFTRLSSVAFTVDIHDVGLTGRDQDFSFLVFSI